MLDKLWFEFVISAFPVAETYLFAKDMSHSHAQITSQLQCCSSPLIAFVCTLFAEKFSSCPGRCPILHSRYSAWNRTSFLGTAPAKQRTRARRQQNTGLWNNQTEKLPNVCPCLSFFANLPQHFRMSFGTPCWTESWTKDHPVPFASLSRTCLFLCLSRLSFSVPSIASSTNWCIVIRYNIFRRCAI